MRAMATTTKQLERQVKIPSGYSGPAIFVYTFVQWLPPAIDSFLNVRGRVAVDAVWSKNAAEQ